MGRNKYTTCRDCQQLLRSDFLKAGKHQCANGSIKRRKSQIIEGGCLENRDVEFENTKPATDCIQRQKVGDPDTSAHLSHRSKSTQPETHKTMNNFTKIGFQQDDDTLNQPPPDNTQFANEEVLHVVDSGTLGPSQNPPSGAGHDQCNILMDDLRQNNNWLQEKLETKDAELLQLRAANSTLQGENGKLLGENGKLHGELSGLNAVKSLLKEKDDENYKLKREVDRLTKGSPINPHKQCEILQLQLRTQLKESEELSQATFDRLNQRIEDLKVKLIKRNTRFDERKQKFKDMPAASSIAPSSHRNPVCLQNNNNDSASQLIQTEQKDVQLDNGENSKLQELTFKTKGESYCCYCDHFTSKLRADHLKQCQLWERFCGVFGNYGKQWKARISDFEMKEAGKHITLFPHYHQMFVDVKTSLHQNDVVALKVVESLQKDLGAAFASKGDQSRQISQGSGTKLACTLQSDFVPPEKSDAIKSGGFYYCSLCSTDFLSFGARFQHYQKCDGLKRRCDGIKSQLKSHKSDVDKRQSHFIQTAISFEGNNLTDAFNIVNLVKEIPQPDKTAKDLQGADYNELLQLYNQMHDTDYFKEAWSELVAGPVADANGNPVYAQYASRENLVKVLGKRRRCSNTKFAREVISKAKQELGISLSLEERRNMEAEDIKQILKRHNKDMLNIKDYLNCFKDMQQTDPFEKIGGIFCDGIILPRLEQLFSTYKDFEAQFHTAGIQVQKISPAQKEGFVYVRLMDSANNFTAKFILDLNALVQDFRKQLKEKGYTNQAIKDCFVQQIDCTQDLKGFFLSFDVKNDIECLSKLMKMNLTHDYPTFESLFTLLSKENYGSDEQPLLLKQTRFKIYNKLLHLLESEQGKKKISMNLKALLNCSSRFYQKLRQCFDSGVSRLEFSHYFYSFEEQQKADVIQYQQQIDSALGQANKLPQIRYQVSFEKFFDQFWRCSKPVFIFQKDSWTVVYAKHSVSAYVGQTVKITQKRFNETDKINCIKRFAVPGRWCTVIDVPSDRVYKVMKTGSKLMQLPIQSLNTTHCKAYEFPFDNDTLKYHLSNQQIQNIQLILETGEHFQFVCDDQELNSKKRCQKSNQKVNQAKGGIDVTELLQEKRILNKRFKVFNNKGQQLFGSICRFFTTDTGRTYHCETCSAVLRAQGKLKKPLLMFV